MRKVQLTINHEEVAPATSSDLVITSSGKSIQEELSAKPLDQFSSSTVAADSTNDILAGAYEGPYESGVLKGKSLVNQIQCDSAPTITLPYEFEDAWQVTVEDTKEKGALNVNLKGLTLLNMARPHKEKTVIFNSRWQTYNVINNIAPYSLIEGEMIYMSMEVKVHEINIDSPDFRCMSHRGSGGYAYGVKTFEEIKAFPKNKWIRISAIRYVKEVESLKNYSLQFGVQGEHPTTAGEQIARVSFRNPIWINLTRHCGKGNEPTTEEQTLIPYFSGMLNVKSPTVRTFGQNLFNHEKPQLKTLTNNQMSLNGTIFRSEYTNLRDSYVDSGLLLTAGTYWLSFEIRGELETLNTSSRAGIFFSRQHSDWYQGDVAEVYRGFGQLSDEFISVSKKIVVTEPTKVYICFHGWQNNMTGWTEIKDIQITKSDELLPYQRYSDRVLSLPSDIQLSGLPSGVCDTLDTVTGEYVQNVYEYTLDENTVITYNGRGEDYVNFDVSSTNNNMPDGLMYGAVISDAEPPFEFQAKSSRFTKFKLYFTEENGLTSESTSYDYINCAKELLREKPIKVQYTLGEPIKRVVALSESLKPWSGVTHIRSESCEGSLPPIFSHLNPSYPVRIEPNTVYTILSKNAINDHRNADIHYNLGGNGVTIPCTQSKVKITTPATLSHEELRMSGRGTCLSHLMVIKGDLMDQTVPFIEGLSGVKMPVIRNTGKNLWDPKWNSLYKNASQNELNLGSYSTIKEPVLRLKPNTQYTFLFQTDTVPKTNGSATICFKCDHLPMEGIGPNIAFVTIDRRVNTNKETTLMTDDTGLVYLSVLDYSFSSSHRNDIIIGLSYLTIHVEETETFNGHESYRSNVVAASREITLRELPNGVCDTYNVITGEYTQRIGEVVLDGSENWSGQAWGAVFGLPYDKANIAFEGIKGGDTGNINSICDFFPTKQIWTEADNGEYIFTQDNRIQVVYNKETRGNIKSWLAERPIKIFYELMTPIVTMLPATGVPSAYKNGHLVLESGFEGPSLLPELSYTVPTSKNGVLSATSKAIVNHEKRLAKLEDLILRETLMMDYRATLNLLEQSLF